MIAVLLALTFALSSQHGSSLSGRVVNAENVPIPRMVVRLHSGAGGTPAETLTDTEGRYAFRNVAAIVVETNAQRSSHTASRSGSVGTWRASTTST